MIYIYTSLIECIEVSPTVILIYNHSLILYVHNILKFCFTFLSKLLVFIILKNKMFIIIVTIIINNNNGINNIHGNSNYKNMCCHVV